MTDIETRDIPLNWDVFVTPGIPQSITSDLPPGTEQWMWSPISSTLISGQRDAVIVSTEGPIDEQVRRIVGPQGVKYAIDPVVGETGTQIYQALGEEGRMLVYGSLTGEPIRVGADPRLILAGRRILEVFWLGYWFSKLDETVRTDLVQEIVTLLRDGILVTSTATRRFSLDEIGAAVKQAESIGRQGKVLLVPEKQ